jgi:uncharacterized protein YbjT (DUF2867 family)
MSAVLVTGATGFTGSAVVRLLLAQGHSVRCFVRPTSDRSWLPATGIDWAVGDVGDVGSLAAALAGIDVLVNVASLGFGHAPTIVEAAREAGVPRAVFVSTTALLTTIPVQSKAVRAAAEALIVESGIAATILRPTMIYGSRRDRNISRLIGYVKASPLIPVFGSGRHLQQPVHVDDVAAAIACSALTPLATGRTYTVAGPQALSYNQVIDAVAAAVGRRVLKVHLPASPVVAALSRLESVGIKLPIKSEQVLRLEEDKVFEIADAVRDLGFSPRSFQEGVRLEVAEMAGNA